MARPRLMFRCRHDGLGELRIGVAGEDHHSLEGHGVPPMEDAGRPSERSGLPDVLVAGEVGIEPTNAGIKIRCLTTWRLPKGNRSRATTSTCGQRPQRVAVQRASNKSGRFSGVSTGVFAGNFCHARHPRERLLRGAFGSESGEHARSRSGHPRSPTLAPRATARRDCRRLREPRGRNRLQIVAAISLGKDVYFRGLAVVVSIQAQRTSPAVETSIGGDDTTNQVGGRLTGVEHFADAARDAPFRRTRKTGTSAPSSSARRISACRDSPSCHSRLSPSSTVAASELPPPMPPPTGMRLSTAIVTPCAIPHARLQQPGGAYGQVVIGEHARGAAQRARHRPSSRKVRDTMSARPISTSNDSSVW